MSFITIKPNVMFGVFKNPSIGLKHRLPVCIIGAILWLLDL